MLRLAALIVGAILVGACQQTIPKEALQLSPDSLERRQAQTRVFETEDEAQVLSASAALLQDLGFTLDESEVDLGVIVGSKKRDATEAGQVALSIVMAALFGVQTPWDDEQKIRASVITRKIEERNGYAVRLTMQRIVWDTQGRISRTEPLDESEMYQEFFDKLSKAVFLEAQEL
ncbi:MAG: hypothetical protein OEM93_16290 [Rhodospirillales bacterium]|nr:hypothetical protein [Rhodospirillales bacterium]